MATEEMRANPGVGMTIPTHDRQPRLCTNGQPITAGNIMMTMGHVPPVHQELKDGLGGGQAPAQPQDGLGGNNSQLHEEQEEGLGVSSAPHHGLLDADREHKHTKATYMKMHPMRNVGWAHGQINKERTYQKHATGGAP